MVLVVVMMVQMLVMVDLYSILMETTSEPTKRSMYQISIISGGRGIIGYSGIGCSIYITYAVLYI